MKAEVDEVENNLYVYLGDGPTPTHIIKFESVTDLMHTLHMIVDMVDVIVQKPKKGVSCFPKSNSIH